MKLENYITGICFSAPEYMKSKEGIVRYMITNQNSDVSFRLIKI